MMTRFMFSLLLLTLAVGCTREPVPVPSTAVPRTTVARSTLPPDAATPIGQLIAFLQSKGIGGEYAALPVTSVAGVTQRGSFKGKGFAVTFYHFNDADLASSVAAEGMNGRTCYANGKLVMEAPMADDALVQAFIAYQ
jgi:hypothetical protein